MNSESIIIEQAKLFCKYDPLGYLHWSIKMKKHGVTWLYDIAIENNLIIKTEK